MHRVFLHYKGEYVHLPDGETIVGRDLLCRLRFNDPSVSRRHFRITVADGVAFIEDMGSTNGTKVNRVRLTERVPLCHHDKIQVGGRELTVHVLDEDELGEGPESSTLVDVTPPSPPDPPDDVRATQRLASALADSAVRRQTCGHCGAEVDPFMEHCRGCGSVWNDYRVSSRTLVDDAARSAERRRHPRAEVDIPVVYSSDTLEVQSIAKNLSLSGMFVSTEFLDAVGTDCQVIVMAEGGAAFALAGRVARVIQSGHPEGIPPGLGIEFVAMDGDARQWLWRTLRQQLGTEDEAK